LFVLDKIKYNNVKDIKEMIQNKIIFKNFANQMNNREA